MAVAVAPPVDGDEEVDKTRAATVFFQNSGSTVFFENPCLLTVGKGRSMIGLNG